MSRTSIRQPLFIYAVVLTLGLCLSVLLFAGVALSRASFRAFRRAVRQDLTLFIEQGHLPETLSYEVPVGIVSSTTASFGIHLEEARAAAHSGHDYSQLVVVPAHQGEFEIYWIALVPTDTPTSIALVELSRIMPGVLLVCLLGAGLMALLVYRQLLPSLRALADVAESPDGNLPLSHSGKDAPNEIVEIAVRFKETTRMLRAARERAETQRDELEQMQSSLIRASKLASVGRLAAGIAHEVGNPLAAVKGYLSIMKDGLPEETRNDVLDRSIVELERIHQTIEKLLTYSRKGNEEKLEAGPIRLEDPLEEALHLSRGHPVIRGIELIDHVPRDGQVVLGHAVSVSQVLVNLILNAGHAMGGAGQIVLSREETADRVVQLSVQDSGPGVAPDLAEAIFDPFFTTKDPGEGTGLGLAVSRAMMERMGGDLLLSASESGARFVLRFPKP